MSGPGASAQKEPNIIRTGRGKIVLLGVWYANQATQSGPLPKTYLAKAWHYQMIQEFAYKLWPVCNAIKSSQITFAFSIFKIA